MIFSIKINFGDGEQHLISQVIAFEGHECSAKKMAAIPTIELLDFSLMVL